MLFLRYGRLKMNSNEFLSSIFFLEMSVWQMCFLFFSLRWKPLCVFSRRTSWRWCNRSCLFKGRRDGVIHSMAMVRPVVHDVTMIRKYWVEEGSLLVGSLPVTGSLLLIQQQTFGQVWSSWLVMFSVYLGVQCLCVCGLSDYDPVVSISEFYQSKRFILNT